MGSAWSKNKYFLSKYSHGKWEGVAWEASGRRLGHHCPKHGNHLVKKIKSFTHFQRQASGVPVAQKEPAHSLWGQKKSSFFVGACAPPRRTPLEHSCFVGPTFSDVAGRQEKPGRHLCPAWEACEKVRPRHEILTLPNFKFGCDPGADMFFAAV